MRLEMWRPFIDLEKEWESLMRLPRLMVEGREFPFRPSMDVAQTDGELEATIELPGIDPAKDIEITVDEDFLTIQGEKSEEKELTEEDRYVHERRYGKFIRRIPVPEGVTPDNVTADYTQGVLKVKVTLPEEKAPAEPKKIPIEVKKS